MFILALFLASGALADEVQPAAVCGQSHVLQAVEARLSRAGQPVVVEPGSVGQISGPEVGLVYCAVRVRQAVYNTPRYGTAPVDVVQEYRYSLELRRNGVFLLP